MNSCKKSLFYYTYVNKLNTQVHGTIFINYKIKNTYISNWMIILQRIDNILIDF